MEVYRRKEHEYLNVDTVQILSVWNKDHPFTEVFLNILQECPKEAKSNFEFKLKKDF